MRQTGGTALGEISTRSRPRSRAILRASKGGRTPSCSPFSSITRISRARIRSLMRINCFAERLSMCRLQVREDIPRLVSIPFLSEQAVDCVADCTLIVTAADDGRGPAVAKFSRDGRYFAPDGGG